MKDNVNHPGHYNTGKIEVIEFLEDQALEPHEWNAVKYVCRAKHKGKRIEDLEKAIWYLKRKLELLKAETERRAPLRPNAMNSEPKPFDIVEEKPHRHENECERCLGKALFFPTDDTGIVRKFCTSHMNVWHREQMPLERHPDCDEPGCTYCEQGIGIPK